VDLNTASAVLSFARKLEEDSAKYYNALSETFKQENEVFLGFVKENNRYIIQAERAYFGVISDALEGCYSFSIDVSKYEITPPVEEKNSFQNTIQAALKIEKAIISFYNDAAEQSKPFLAEVPRIFTMISKSRQKRLVKLESYLIANYRN
jgi:rubrerythrin